MKEINLESLLELFETKIMDRHFYCRTFDVEGKEWELQRISVKLNEKKCWKLKKVASNEWKWCSTKDLIFYLNIHGLAHEYIESELISIIKSTIVLNNLFNEDAKQLFGDDIVDKAMEEYHAFSKTLLETLETHLGINKPSEKPILRLVHNKDKD